MSVPPILIGHVVDLHEAHAALHEPARKQTLPAKSLRRRVLLLDAIVTLCDGSFLIEVSDFERARLHSIRELVAGGPCIEFGKACVGRAVPEIQVTDQIERISLAISEFCRR